MRLLQIQPCGNRGFIVCRLQVLYDKWRFRGLVFENPIIDSALRRALLRALLLSPYSLPSWHRQLFRKEISHFGEFDKRLWNDKLQHFDVRLFHNDAIFTRPNSARNTTNRVVRMASPLRTFGREIKDPGKNIKKRNFSGFNWNFANLRVA